MQRLDLHKVCVLIPAYNAEQTLGSVLEKVRPLQMDTIVVNDGSEDETKRVAVERGALLLDHPSNLGKGAALRTGFNYILEKAYQVVILLMPTANMTLLRSRPYSEFFKASNLISSSLPGQENLVE